MQNSQPLVGLTGFREIRAKMDEYPHPKWEISTIWGVGYKFEVKGNEA